jgi:hypothetical protein
MTGKKNTKNQEVEPASDAAIVPAGSTLYQQVRAILEAARGRAARSVNTEMVRAYWSIGQAIVEHEQAEKSARITVPGWSKSWRRA